MADLNQLQEAMAATLKSMAEDLLQKGQTIETLKQQRSTEEEEFNRLFQSFLSLTGQKVDTVNNIVNTGPVSLDKNIQQSQAEVQNILKTQQAAMQQANPPQVKMPAAQPKP